ncbi:uncharacterized protein G2W53_012933 [Senna tora]|uniref:Uncharacterized protein n=1 Tax=Senna tora TaxID=362788 RepID=A0A834WP00_9FABA|nr:uncharacterized protein G2W53_012933 [Senna tora]
MAMAIQDGSRSTIANEAAPFLFFH